MVSFGRNNYGQLGYGDNNNRGDEANEMGDYLPEVQLPTGFVIDELFISAQTNYLLSNEGRIIPFGYNTHGQCGLGHSSHVGNSAGHMGNSLEAIDLGTDFLPVKLGGGQGVGCAKSTQGAWKWYVDCVGPICLSVILSLSVSPFVSVAGERIRALSWVWVILIIVVILRMKWAIIYPFSS